MVVSDENAESVSVWQWNVAKVGELLVSRQIGRVRTTTHFGDYRVYQDLVVLPH